MPLILSSVRGTFLSVVRAIFLSLFYFELYGAVSFIIFLRDG